MNDALEAVEGGKPWGSGMLEIGEDIVLDDGEPRLFGQFQHPVRRHRRKHRPGRVVDGGIGDVEARLVFAQDRGELLDIRAARRIGNADDMGAMGAQESVEIEVAGIVHQNGVAGLKQKPAQEIERLRARFGQHDLVRRCVDAVLAHPPRDQLAQRRQAERRAVVGKRRTLGAR